MSIIMPPPQCLFCRHWVSPFDRGDWFSTVQTCAAFPVEIPTAVWHNQLDHRRPLPGDHGVTFVAVPGREFPERAFAPRAEQPDDSGV